jgi:molybdopterin molybdotransferase
MGARQGARAIDPLAAREAAIRILDEVRRQPPLRLPLDDALGCVLAEPVTSPLDIPAWTNSAMDGYAARGDDVRGAAAATPRILRVIESIPAGQFPSQALSPGECARIFTGAPLPEGADSVIRQEDTDLGVERVTITRDRDVGVNIRYAGEDIRTGTTVFEPGVELGAAHLGVLASLAISHPVVYRRPRVGILGSGDEIVDVDRPEEILSGRKVASSNTHTLMALVRLAGGIPVNLGIARDTPESVREHLEQAGDCDLVVTTAGISVGEHDHLRGVIEAMGGRLDFWKLRMRPGAPVGFGSLAARPSDRAAIPWIGLPGNPVSTMVTFELFVRPAIRKMVGHPLPFRAATEVEVSEAIRLGPKLQHFLRAIVSDRRSACPSARLTGPQGSGILTSMLRANALLIIPEGQHETPEGALADALLLDDLRHQPAPPF